MGNENKWNDEKKSPDKGQQGSGGFKGPQSQKPQQNPNPHATHSTPHQQAPQTWNQNKNRERDDKSGSTK